MLFFSTCSAVKISVCRSLICMILQGGGGETAHHEESPCARWVVTLAINPGITLAALVIGGGHTGRRASTVSYKAPQFTACTHTKSCRYPSGRGATRSCGDIVTRRDGTQTIEVDDRAGQTTTHARSSLTPRCKKLAVRVAEPFR